MITFDARTAKALKAGDHLTFPEAPGLRLEASRTRRTWTYRYKSPVDGRMRQVRLGHWPAMSAAAAVVEWEKRRQERDAGDDPAAKRREARQVDQARRAQVRHAAAQGGYTVADACTDYIEGYLRKAASKKYAYEANRMLTTMLGDLAARPLASVMRADAFGLIESYSGIPVQAGKLRQLLGAVWDRAIDAGRVPDDTPNWWRLVLRGKLRSKGKRIAGEHVGTAKRVLSDDEVAELLPWLPNFTALIQDVLELYLWTCCRGSEIVAMERSEISEESDGLWWTIPKAKQKVERHERAEDLRVPLVGRAEAVVRRRLLSEPGQWLFPSRKGDVPHVQQKVIQVAVYQHQPYSESRPEWERPRLPVTRWAPHDLRRTGRTRLAALGCPDAVAEAILGHIPPGIQGVYNLHRYDQERRQWLAKLSAHWERLAQRKRRPQAPSK